MIKKLLAKLMPQKPVQKDPKLIQAQKYYQIVRCGAMFLEFIKQDLKMQQGQGNRHVRRRMERELEDLKLTPEIIEYYKSKTEQILAHCEKELNAAVKAPNAK